MSNIDTSSHIPNISISSTTLPSIKKKTQFDQIETADSSSTQPNLPLFLTPNTLHRRYSIAKMKLPKRIILIRHGQSLGNINETAYCTIPDWRIPLTPLGKKQASEVGKKLLNIIGSDAPITIYTSPYIRTKQTLALLMKELPNNPVLSVREEPRLTEQQFVSYIL